MTTDYMALPVAAKVADAIEAMRTFEGRMESMSTIYISGSRGKLAGAVPLAKIVLAPPATPLLALTGAAGFMSSNRRRKRKKWRSCSISTTC